jgi:hypothetical protein
MFLNKYLNQITDHVKIEKKKTNSFCLPKKTAKNLCCVEVHLKLFPLEVILVLLFVMLQSTASFFQDKSVPLGRLIGIRPGNGGLYFPRRVHADEQGKIAVRAIRAASSEVSGARRADMSHGICIPLLAGTLEKMSRSKSKSSQ